jgi:hypothetical protein
MDKIWGLQYFILFRYILFRTVETFQGFQYPDVHQRSTDSPVVVRHIYTFHLTGLLDSLAAYVVIPFTSSFLWRYAYFQTLSCGS